MMSPVIRTAGSPVPQRIRQSQLKKTTKGQSVKTRGSKILEKKSHGSIHKGGLKATKGKRSQGKGFDTKLRLHREVINRILLNYACASAKEAASYKVAKAATTVTHYVNDPMDIDEDSIGWPADLARIDPNVFMGILRGLAAQGLVDQANRIFECAKDARAYHHKMQATRRW